MRNLYEVLGVPKDSSIDDIRKAYKKLCMTLHPDRAGGSEECFKEVNEAYEVLSDTDRRSNYDLFGTTKASNIEEKVRTVVLQLIINAVESEDGNIIESARSKILEANTNNAASRKQLDLRIAKVEKRIKLIKRKDGDDTFLLRALENHLQTILDLIPKLDEVDELNSKILSTLDEYEDIIENNPADGGFFYTFIDAVTGQPVTMRTI